VVCPVECPVDSLVAVCPVVVNKVNKKDLKLMKSIEYDLNKFYIYKYINCEIS